MDNIYLYLLFGLGIYFGMALNNTKSFKEAKIIHIFNGLVICWLLWPIGVLLKVLIIWFDDYE